MLFFMLKKVWSVDLVFGKPLYCRGKKKNHSGCKGPVIVIKPRHFNYRIYCYASNHFVTSVSPFSSYLFTDGCLHVLMRCE